MSILDKHKKRRSRKELEERIVELENINSHLRQNINNRKRIAQEVREACVQREIDALDGAEKKRIDILIDYQDNIRYVSKKYLKLSGYTQEDIVGIKYYKLLKGNKEKIRAVFRSPEQKTGEVAILGKPDKYGRYDEIEVTATTNPVLIYNEQRDGHTLASPAFTRVSLEKKKIRKIDKRTEKEEKKQVKAKVNWIIAKTKGEVSQMIRKKKNS